MSLAYGVDMVFEMGDPEALLYVVMITWSFYSRGSPTLHPMSTHVKLLFGWHFAGLA